MSDETKRTTSRFLDVCLAIYLTLVFLAGLLGFHLPINDSGWGGLFSYFAVLIIAFPWSPLIMIPIVKLNLGDVLSYCLLWGGVALNIMILMKLRKSK